MSGLMRRLTRGRAATDDEGTPQASAASEPVGAADDTQQGDVAVPANGKAPDPDKTAVLSPVEEPQAEHQPGLDLPAGVDPKRLAAAPDSARRGRLRKRLRYLRAVREILLRDLGGFYYEAQRAEGGASAHERLLEKKSRRLAKLDDEVRDLESRLEEERPETVALRQPGLGGTCPQCGEIHGSDARFCSHCGTALNAKATRAQPAKTGPTAAPATSAPATSAAGDQPKATTASLWGRPKRLSAATDPTVSEPPADKEEAKPAERSETEAAEREATDGDEAATRTGSERS